MFRLLRVLTGLLALALGLELGTRLDERVRWGTPVRSTASAIGDIITIDSLGARGIPGEQYRQFAFNSLGLRGPELDAHRPRILVLGASETFGLYETVGKEYPQQLQDSLAAAGCPVTVVNAALPGFSLPTLSVTFRHRLRALGASLAVVYPTPVQYLEEQPPEFHVPLPSRSARPLPAYFRATRRLRDHLKAILPSTLKTFLRGREIEAQRRDLGGGPQWTAIPDDRMRAYRDDLGALLDTLSASGVRTLVATHASVFAPGAPVDTAVLVSWAKFYPKASMDLLPAFERAANVVTMKVALGRGLPVSDLADEMTRYAGDSVFADFSHFTAIGSGKVAGRLSRDLLGALGCPTRDVHGLP